MLRTKLPAIKYILLLILALCTSIYNCQTHKSNHGINLDNEKECDMRIIKPNKISHTYEQTINGSIDEIFPLYCPVRETEWCYGWEPKIVYSNSGVVEPGCIFITEDSNQETIWYVTVYDIEQGHLEMIYITPGVIFTKLEITVEPISDKVTKAVITYSKTSLGKAGEEILKGFTDEYYNSFMKSWENEMNYFLKTGEMLKD